MLFILEIYKLFGQINDKWQALLLADDCSFVHANMGIHTESSHVYNFFICFCDGSYFNVWNFFRSERCVCQAYADITPHSCILLFSSDPISSPQILFSLTDSFRSRMLYRLNRIFKTGQGEWLFFFFLNTSTTNEFCVHMYLGISVDNLYPY